MCERERGRGGPETGDTSKAPYPPIPTLPPTRPAGTAVPLLDGQIVMFDGQFFSSMAKIA